MTTTPPDPANESASGGRRAKSDRHAQLSKWLLKHAQEQLERGDTMQASEKAYGAVFHAAKGYGELRGWNHFSHYRVGLIYDQLSDEESDLTLSSDFGIIESLHNNYLEYELPTNRVRGGLDVARKLVERLDNLRDAQPNPLPSSSLNREQRRRLSQLMQPPAREQVAVEDLPPLEDLPE